MTQGLKNKKKEKEKRINCVGDPVQGLSYF
jgi:hypothetical protein